MNLTNPTRRIHDRCGNQHTGHGTLLSPGIHHHPAAHGAGDAQGKSHPLQPVSCGKLAEHLQPNPGHHPQRYSARSRILRNLLDVPEMSQVDHHPFDPAVRSQQVGAVPDDSVPDSGFCGPPNEIGQMNRRGRREKRLHRSAHSKRGVPGHGFIPPNMVAHASVEPASGRFVQSGIRNHGGFHSGQINPNPFEML